MYRKIKRLLDLIIAVIAFPILVVLFIIFAPIIHFSDGGPIFYNAQRIGRKGKIFKMYKFRTMKVNAPDIRLADGSTYNGANDPRVTKIGKFLRTTSIDEVPQVINILDGTMSLIGPRPDPPDWLERYPEDIKVFLTVRPGITGYCQAYWRNGANAVEKMRADAYYATHLTFLFDLKIFIKTILMVLGHKNTYKDLENESEAVNAIEGLFNYTNK